MRQNLEIETFSVFESYGIVTYMRLMSAGKKKRQPQKQPKSKSQKGNKERKNILPDVANRPTADKAPTKAPDTARVVLLPVDPYLIHAYWTLSLENIGTRRLLLGKEHEEAETVLRFYANRLAPDRPNAFYSFDVRVDLNAPNWYVHLWAPDKSYYADLGLRTKDGRFFSFVRSNAVDMPRVGPPAGEGTGHMPAKADFQHIGQLSIAQPHATHPAASGAAPSVDLTAISEGAFVSGSSSIPQRSDRSGT